MKRLIVLAAYSAAFHNLKNELYAIIDALDYLIEDDELRTRCLVSLKYIAGTNSEGSVAHDDLESLKKLLSTDKTNFSQVKCV